MDTKTLEGDTRSRLLKIQTFHSDNTRFSLTLIAMFSSLPFIFISFQAHFILFCGLAGGMLVINEARTMPQPIMRVCFSVAGLGVFAESIIIVAKKFF